MRLRHLITVIVRFTLAVVVALLSIPTASNAQGKPRVPYAVCPPGGCTYTVSVTPDGELVQRPPNSGPHSAVFNVENNGNTSGGYTLTCKALGGVVCKSISPTGVTLAPGADANVNVLFTVTTGGTLTLTATRGTTTNSGSYNISASGPGLPVLTLRNYSDSTLDRSLCLTSGAGEAGAASCGDLLVEHAMPGYTTMGRERTLTLVYNSRDAYSRPLITVAAKQPSTVTMPTAVYAELEVAGVVRRSATYYPWINSTLQIALSYDAVGVGHVTGVYPFTVRVQNQYGAAAHTAAISGRLIVVNRHDSEFGAGIWLSGVERILSQTDGSMLWIGGDGSAKIYGAAGTNRWLAPAGAFRDELVFNPVDSTYTRTLRHGVQVTFDAGGFHIRTTNRTGQKTVFTWASNRLTSITVPPGGSTGVTYTLSYDAVTGKLDRITDPANRVLDLTITNGVLVAAKDPDNKSVTFGYDTDRKMTSRQNRRGFITTYQYAKSHRLTKVTIPTGRAAGDNAVAVTDIQPWDEWGLAVGTGTQIPVDTGQAFTRIIGPRASTPDDATFWVDRWGAPTKILPVNGGVTTLVRGDLNNPALVTEVTYPNGRVVTMGYNGRGNLTLTKDVTAGLPDKVIRYGYDNLEPAMDSPDTLMEPFGRRTLYTYNTLGLTETVADPRNHQTRFFYRSGSTDPLRGALDSVTEMLVRTWKQSDSSEVDLNQTQRFTYNTLGNLHRAKSPVGVSTTYDRDAMGRVTVVWDPYGTRRQWDYDPLNRVTQVSQYTAYQPQGFFDPMAGCNNTLVSCFGVMPPTSPPPGLGPVLITRYAHAASTLDTVIDPRGARRGFVYDARGLVIAERDEHQKVRTAFYNEAGLMDSVITRTGHRVRYAYDVLGRRTSMIYDARVYGEGCQNPATCVIPGDTVEYTYDIMGNQLSTTNGEGTISRAYFDDGSLKQQVRVLSSGQLPDTLQFSYDAARMRTKVVHRSAAGIDSTVYGYNAGTGDLDTLRFWWRSSPTPYRFSFLYDQLGRRRQVTYPHGPVATLSYDALGIMRRLRSTSPGTGNADPFKFDLVNQKVDPLGNIIARRMVCAPGVNEGNPCGWGQVADQVVNAYNRLGMLVSQEHNPGPASKVDSMDYDASGNLRYHRDGTLGKTHLFGMEDTPKSNRMRSDTLLQMQYRYFDDGARDHEHSTREPYQDRWYYYDGLGRTTGTVNWYREDTFFGLSDNARECRYDADGQLAKPCANLSQWLAFDGPNVSGAANATGVVRWRFVHGPGVDDPLMAMHEDGGDRWSFFWLTDGQGREYGAADSTNDQGGYKTHFLGHGGKYAGGTSAASSFAADRFGTPQVPQVSFFRNRAYDQRTGRWTQEDPIGLAGGMNLYQFNGNNPVTYTDPFGLCPPVDRNINDCPADQKFIHMMAAHGRGIEAGVSIYAGVVGTVMTAGGAAELGAASGAITLGIARATAAAGAAAEPSRRMIGAFQQQMSQHGAGSLIRSAQSISERLTTHLTKLADARAAGGRTSSIEREIRTFQRQLEAIRRVLGE